MNVTYIHHSAFLIETEREYLLFDYYKGEVPKLNLEKPLYIFASHRHWDHYGEIIFELGEEGQEVTYILSDDIKPKDSKGRNVHGLPPGVDRQIGTLRIETLKSTDEGVAFLVTTQKGESIYHGGDLNDWVWSGESDEWNRKMTEHYHRFLEPLRGRTMDVAMLVVDARQEENFARGFDYFMKEMNVKTVFPMHFWEKYDLLNSLLDRKESEDWRERVVRIDHCKQSAHTVQ